MVSVFRRFQLMLAGTTAARRFQVLRMMRSFYPDVLIECACAERVKNCDWLRRRKRMSAWRLCSRATADCDCRARTQRSMSRCNSNCCAITLAGMYVRTPMFAVFVASCRDNGELFEEAVAIIQKKKFEQQKAYVQAEVTTQVRLASAVYCTLLTTKAARV